MTSQSGVTTAMKNSSSLDRVSSFIIHEMQLLDDRNFEDWMGLFTEEGFYWAPVQQGQKDPHSHVSLFFDQKPTMKTRIARLRHPKIFMQNPPSRTVHLVSNFCLVEPPADHVTAVRCNFIMLEYRPTRTQNIWGGRYDYHLVADKEDDYKIAMKKASLVTSDGQFPSLALWF